MLELPKIAVVIIGVNVADYLKKCIDSILNSDYPNSKLNVIYVDGGSTDNSTAIARQFIDLTVIELRDPHPTPGKGRNAGLRAAKENVVQFMDADTVIDPNWFKKAFPYMDGKVAAVCGNRREKYPDKNIYHKIGNAEWRYEEGKCRYFGGEVLIRKDIAEQVKGFDEKLIAGEDPDLSYRIRQIGWDIYRINEEMSTHDLNMNRFSQYLKRAYRSGYAYAEIGLRYSRYKEKLWLKELGRIVFNFSIPLIVFIIGVIVGKTMLGLLLSFIIAFRQTWKFSKYKQIFKFTTIESILYCLHLSFVVYPQFTGVMRYLFAIISRVPLQNKGYIKAED